MNKEKRTILFLTNKFNEEPKEDILLINYLRNYFEVIISHPLKCKKFENKADIILVRNIWPTFNYLEKLNKVMKRWKNNKLLIYNPLRGKGDMQGKDYLLELYKRKYPVIPSVDNVKDLDNLPLTEEFFIKPKDREDAVGTERITKIHLLKRKLKNHIIQPYIDFVYEVSFHFIDGRFVYAFTTKRKVGDYKIKEYTPSKKDIEFAKKFVRWNSLPYGLQRIDACRTKQGNLLLVEVEDWCPYIDLLYVSKKTREKILNKLVASIKKQLIKTD